MPDLHIPDRSNVNWRRPDGSVDTASAALAWLTYGAGGGRAGITKVSEGGGFIDVTFPQVRQAMKDGDVLARGFYHFLHPGDGVAQAQLFTRLVGQLEPGEWAICDAEIDGASADVARAFCDEVDRALGTRTWIYSYASFGNANGLWTLDRPQWLAAYSTVEPGGPTHTLWQHTNGVNGNVCDLPGVGTGDCSIFHGSIDDLLNIIGGDMPLTDADKAWIVDAVGKAVHTVIGSDGVAGAGDVGRMADGYFLKNADGSQGAWVPGYVERIKAAIAPTLPAPVDVSKLAQDVAAAVAPQLQGQTAGAAVNVGDLAAQLAREIGKLLTAQPPVVAP